MDDTEYRVCNTSDLRVLNSKSPAGRQISPAVNAALDPDGTHVLHLVLFGHNMDNTDNVLHHRVRVLAKIVGTNEPAEATIDIADSDWRRLHAYEKSG